MTESRYEIINGDPFRLPLQTGWTLRADSMGSDGAVDTQEILSAEGVASYTPTDDGVYYLAIRETINDAWERVGELHVVALIDATAERLRKELADLDQQVGELKELIQYQVTDPSGTSVTRFNLAQVRAARSRAETRLADYLRIKQGRYPMRLA